jgi:enhancing lycopene biosynthesis protein 2
MPLVYSSPDSLSYVILYPCLKGGFGAAKNLSSWATEGVECSVEADVQRVITDFHSEKKVQ